MSFAFTKSQPPALRHGRPLWVGFVALSDCAPLVMAQELGLFEAFGLKVKLRREPGWATIRDKILQGEVDAAQAPAGVVFAATLGLGCVPTPCVTGLVLNLHGNAITLSEPLWELGVRDGATLRGHALDHGPLTFGVAFQYSSHHFLLRRWLRAHDIDPEHDVRLVSVPPPQMFATLQGGHLDGYCVGEPWNSIAVMARQGWCVAVSPEIAPRHPEKVLMVREDFARERAPEHTALMAALLEACRFCQQPENRERMLETLALPQYVNAPIHALRASMCGTFDFGHGRIEKIPDFNVFSGEDVNAPDAEKAAWVANQLTASGVLDDAQLLPADSATTIFRPDLYAQAAQVARSINPQ
jgi:ABC-type nitrate/sulfonate/bicarbonate transport system substrate-binding protein